MALSKSELNGLKTFLSKRTDAKIIDIDYWADHLNWVVPTFNLLLQIIPTKTEDLDEYFFEDEVRIYLKLISKPWSGPIKVHLL
jgi:hypothetical protein